MGGCLGSTVRKSPDGRQCCRSPPGRGRTGPIGSGPRETGNRAGTARVCCRDLGERDTRTTQIVFRTVVGNAAGSILEAAETERADLIVMGTQGLGGFRKWLLGSTTERLLRRTKVPVLGIPRADESETREADSVSHILAATDFSDSSIAAARIAAHWARALSAKLTLTHIVEPVTVPPQWLPLVEDSDETRVGSARAKLHALAEQICGSQDCDEVVALGRPADLIGSTAVDRRARLIVMGLASEQGAFSPRPGSIAYRVLSSTTVPGTSSCLPCELTAGIGLRPRTDP